MIRKLDVKREIDRQQAEELASCGQDLNALAKRANESQEIADAQAIRDVARLAIRIIDRIEGGPKGTVKISDERFRLMSEVTRIGNNFMQLGSVAQSRRAAETIAMLEAAQERIIACCERMIS